MSFIASLLREAAARSGGSNHKPALAALRQERDRLREALEEIAQGKYAMEAGRRAAEALAVTTETGDEQ